MTEIPKLFYMSTYNYELFRFEPQKKKTKPVTNIAFIRFLWYTPVLYSLDHRQVNSFSQL